MNYNTFKNQELRLFDIQPMECRKTLEINSIKKDWKPHIIRVFQFNPNGIYNRINDAHILNPYQRQCTVSINFIFPKIEKECSCGCGKKLEGRQRRWASDECSSFANAVFSIISGYANSLRVYRRLYVGDYRCEVCGDKPDLEPVELDHLHPVKFGGGGGWLSNYQFKCRKCHRHKTNKDFGFKQLTK
jgi:hypothetical protein